MAALNRELDQSKWTPAERAELDLKGWRSRRAGEWPPVCNLIRPVDYEHDLDRGTLDYDPAWRNYSFHKVLIPARTIVRNCNLSQAVPNTICIMAPLLAVITFVECNLCNVRLRAAWVLQGCCTVQSWIVARTATDASGKDVVIEDREWIAAHPGDLPAILTPPANAVTSRGF